MTRRTQTCRPSTAMIALLAMTLLAWSTSSAWARTITIEAAEMDQAAVIAQAAPRLSWAAAPTRSDMYTTVHVDIRRGSAMLLRFPLDRIPPGMRVTRAELIVPVYYRTQPRSRLYVWRMTSNWGPGVCWLYRRTLPEIEPWVRPGASAIGQDRALRPTAVLEINNAENQLVSVTRDVELWYDEAAANHGWMLSVEDAGPVFYMRSPLWSGMEQWQLRVTYEPD